MVNRDAVEGGELRQVVLELGLEVLGGGGDHGLDDDVAQMAVAVAHAVAPGGVRLDLLPGSLIFAHTLLAELILMVADKVMVY